MASKMQTPWRKSIRKKQRPHVDSPELVEAIRAECKRRDEIIRRERAKLPRKLTAKQRERMSQFGFSSVDVRNELVWKFQKPRKKTR